MEDIDSLLKIVKQGESGEFDDEVNAETLAAAQEKLRLLMDGFKTARESQGIMIHSSIYIFAAIILFSTIGFFAYKLVKSLRDKETKREEKRKLKELKKKK